VLDLLEEYPACELPFEEYLDMLPQMTPRYYSISSSPRATPDRCSITVGVVREPAWSGRGTFEGVCSTYLARHDDGTRSTRSSKRSKSGFRCRTIRPTPIIMIGPGTGLAPFRGFLQERAAHCARRRDARPRAAVLRLPPSGSRLSSTATSSNAFAVDGIVEL
jgi:cytochrome P450/NADPH-cytochrome P450 reductase